MGTTSAGVIEHRSNAQRFFVILAAFALLIAQLVVFSGPVAAGDESQSASDAGVVCGGDGPNSLGYNKPAELDDIDGGSGSYTVMDGDAVVGELVWDGRELNFTAEPGWTLDICLKGGNTAPQTWEGVSSIDEYIHDFGISHLGYLNPVFTPPTYDVELVKVWEVTDDPDDAFNEDEASTTLTATPATDLEDGDTFTVTETDVDTGTDQCTVTDTDGLGEQTLDAEQTDDGTYTHTVTNTVTCEPEVTPVPDEVLDEVVDDGEPEPAEESEPQEVAVLAEIEEQPDEDVAVAAEVQEQLPRTGVDTDTLLLLGILLTVLGATAVLLAPQRRFDAA